MDNRGFVVTGLGAAVLSAEAHIGRRRGCATLYWIHSGNCGAVG